MKNLLWLLLAANLVFVLMQWLKPYTAAQASVVTYQPQAQALVLLSEREEPVKAKPKAVEIVEENALVEAIEAELPDQQALAAVTDAGATPQVAPESSSSASQPQLPVRLCYSLGPFNSSDQAGSAALKLQLAGIKADSRALEQQQYMGTLVYLGGFQGKAAAELIGARLKEKNVRDFLVVFEPGKDYAISLGVFREAAYVERRKALMRRLGYSPETEPRYRQRTLYWIDYELADDEATDNDKLSSLIDGLRSEQASLKQLPRDCPAS